MNADSLRKKANKARANRAAEETARQLRLKRAGRQARARFVAEHYDKWLAFCQDQMSRSAAAGGYKIETTFSQYPERCQPYAHDTLRQIADYFHTKGFITHISPFYTPGDHEGPAIYGVTLTVRWNQDA